MATLNHDGCFSILVPCVTHDIPNVTSKVRVARDYAGPRSGSPSVDFWAQYRPRHRHCGGILVRETWTKGAACSNTRVTSKARRGLGLREVAAVERLPTLPIPPFSPRPSSSDNPNNPCTSCVCVCVSVLRAGFSGGSPSLGRNFCLGAVELLSWTL